MIKKLKKHGNSAVLVIDSAIRELLGWTKDQSVEIKTDGKKLVITKAKQAGIPMCLTCQLPEHLCQCPEGDKK